MDEDSRLYEIQSIVPIIHDLATPISSIEATFILMESYKISDESLKSLIKTGKEALTLTKNILTTKDSLLKNLNIEGFNPLASINKVKLALASYIQQNNITLDVNLSSEVLINGKEHVFERILLNLISNSINALNKSQKDFKCIKINDKFIKNKYIITIEDNGNGFSNKSNFGVGLNVVNNNLKKYFNSYLKIDSQLGKYTRINIFLSDFCKN